MGGIFVCVLTALEQASCRMVRRSRHGRDQGKGSGPSAGPAPTPPESPADPPKDGTDRTVIFQKTKMCKFFILGMCAKGPQCRFAHDRSEMNDLPNLYRTKLCKTLINTGECKEPNCRYAHSKEEMRGMPDGPGESKQPDFATAAAAVQSVPAGKGPPRSFAAMDFNQGTPEVTPPPTPHTAAKFAPVAPASMQGQVMSEQLRQQMGHNAPGIVAQAQAQLAMLQMWQAAQASQAQSVQLQALLMQGTAPGSMQAALPGGVQGNLPPAALFGGLAGFPNMSMVPTGQAQAAGGLTQPGLMPDCSEFSGLSLDGAPTSAAAAASVNAGHLNTLAQEHKAVAAAAASLHASGSPSLDLDAPEFTPVIQAAHEPAHIAPSSLRSIKSSGSICSLGGALDTVAEDDTSPQALASSWLSGQIPDYTGEHNLIVKNTFLEQTVDQSPSCLRLIHSAAGRLDALGEATPTPTASGDGLARPRPGTPDPTDHSSSPGSGGRSQAATASRVVQNPFLDFESAQKWHSGLHSSRSWGSCGQLDVLAEESGREDLGFYRAPENGQHLFARQVSPGSGMPAGALASPGDALRPPEKRLQDTPFAGPLRSVGSGAGSLSALAEEKEEADVSVFQPSDESTGLAAVAPDSSSLPRFQAAIPGSVPLADMLGSGITVKNTFLDFEPCEPRGLGLRPVHTAGGRLDLMGRDG